MPAAARQSAKQHRPHSRRGIGGVPNALFVMAFGVGDGLVVMRRIEQRTNSPPLIYQYDGALIKCLYIMSSLVRMMLHSLFELVQRSQLTCQNLFTCEESELE